MFKLITYLYDSKTPEIKRYTRLNQARIQATKKLISNFDCHRYEIYEICDEFELLVDYKNYDYDSPLVIRDFKAYAKCSRDEIGMREMERESFLWFKYYGYITFYSKEAGVSGGLWTLTPRFREVGLAVRNGELPPEFGF